ncbi:MAG: hypothetical protein ABEL76_11680 [Bradymonadaceae bacterium]
MFRFKISAVHVVLVLGFLGAAHYLVRTNVVTEFELDAETSLRRAATIAEQSKRLDHFALHEKAQMLASDPKTFKYMTLEERPDLYSYLKNEKYSGISASKISEKLGEERRKRKQKKGKEFELTAEDVRHLAVHERLLVGKYRFKNWKKKSSDQRNIATGMLDHRPVRPDMVMALDSEGVGIAALGQDRYSWFGEKVKGDHLKTVEYVISNAAHNPQIDIPKRDLWQWSWRSGDDPSLYQVVLAPIRPTLAEKPAGVIVVGYSIDDGTAAKSQRLLAGVTTREGRAQGADARDLRAAPEVAYFHGQSIVGSTFSTGIVSNLEGRLFDKNDESNQGKLDILDEDRPEKEIRLTIDGDPYMAFVRFFPEEFDVDKPSGMIILSNLKEAKAPALGTLRSLNWIALGLGLLGIILMLLLYHRFIRPLANIEETIGEILSGDEDAEFVLSGEHEVFSSLAQGLNLMSAYLRGEPMPEDEEELEGWGDLAAGGEEPGAGGEGGGESPTVEGVGFMDQQGGSDDEEEG